MAPAHLHLLPSRLAGTRQIRISVVSELKHTYTHTQFVCVCDKQTVWCSLVWSTQRGRIITRSTSQFGGRAHAHTHTHTVHPASIQRYVRIETYSTIRRLMNVVKTLQKYSFSCEAVEGDAKVKTRSSYLMTALGGAFDEASQTV